MASIQTGTQLADNFSAPMMQIINSVNLAAAQMEVLGSTMNRSVDTRTLEGGHKGMNRTAQSMDVGGANAVYLKLSSIISSTEMDIRDNMAAQGTFNQEVERCHSPVSQVKTGLKGWQKAIIAANNGIELVKNTLSRLGVFDIGGVFDRIDTMNRFQKATSIMTGDTNVANAALEQLKNTTKGTAYGLDVASKATQGFVTRGMAIGNATDQVRIWADAVSFYGEGTNEQLSSVMDAIGKMYSKGTVEADQLDILYDAGIGAEEIYANAVGQSLSKVKGDLSQGKITSAQFIDTVSQALDKGASAGAAKDAGSTWETTFANVASTFISENWGVIAPVLLGVAVAWDVYQVAALAASVAQWAMNTALLSCPITWVAIGLGALIALVLILANHFSGAGHIAQSAFGAICGVINVTNQFMDNLLKSALNIGLGIWEVMKACAYNLQTAFHNAICNVQCFFYDMLSAAIGVIESICAALNKLPFVEFDYSGISQAAEHFAARSAEVANSKRDYASIPEAFKKGASTYKTFEDGWIEKAYRNGALFGDFVTDKVKGYFGKNGADRDLGENFSTIPPTLTTGPLSSDVGKIADNTKKTADAVAITSEDLKYIRDLAETDYINRFTTASITVNQTNNNKINSSMDLDGVTEHLRATMEEQMISSAKGVH